MRVRITGDIATVAIKGPLIGIVRAEFEYEFPIDHAERMLSTVCRDDTLEKQRFFVENAGATWHVDVYGGILQGIVIAEIELQQETEELILPGWVGKEITGDSFYKKINMRARAVPRTRGRGMPPEKIRAARRAPARGLQTLTKTGGFLRGLSRTPVQ